MPNTQPYAGRSAARRWRAARRSAANKALHKLSRQADALVRAVAAYLDAHPPRCRCAFCRADLGRWVREDVAGLLYNLRSSAGLIGNQLYPLPPARPGKGGRHAPR